MENKTLTIDRIAEFRLPRYHELPDVGLYLEQVTKYINGFLAPLNCMDITSSMVSNYVKQKLIKSPTKKQYSASQIAELFFIAITKKVLSIENIGMMFQMIDAPETIVSAYDYFCTEFENKIFSAFGYSDKMSPVTADFSKERLMLDEIISASTNVIHLDFFFRVLKSNNE